MIYPLSGIRKEAASIHSVRRLLRVPWRASLDASATVAKPLFFGGAGVGAIGGGVGANAAVNAYERQRQQEDPNYKVSKLGRVGSILAGTVGGGAGGAALGIGGMLAAGRKAAKPVTQRVFDIAERHGMSKKYMTHALKNKSPRGIIGRQLTDRSRNSILDVADDYSLGL